MDNSVKIIDYDHQGRGIGRLNNKIIFIPNTMIGEEVLVNITLNKKNFMEGSVKEYVKKANNRVDGICKYYDSCGGCDILHLPYNEQLTYKQNKIGNIIAKYTKENIKINNIVKSDKQFYYRNKVTFQTDHKNIGFFDKKSHNVVGIDKCLLIQDKLNDEIKNINKNNSKTVIRTNGESIINDYNESLICNIGEYKFYVSLASFFQVNDFVTVKMYDKVKEYLHLTGSESVLDLYCGTGTIGIYISDLAHDVIGIELNSSAIKDAEKNKDLNNVKNVSFICGDVGEVLDDSNIQFDAIIVDPPRSGLDSNAINNIINIKAKKIVYVSCDPMTLARDLNILKEFYNIIEITPFDMFPNTYHVETVSLLELR